MVKVINKEVKIEETKLNFSIKKSIEELLDIDTNKNIKNTSPKKEIVRSK